MTTSDGCGCTTSDQTLYDLADSARQAVSQAYAAERSRYRSLELTRAAHALDALVDALQPIGK